MLSLGGGFLGSFLSERPALDGSLFIGFLSGSAVYLTSFYQLVTRFSNKNPNITQQRKNFEGSLDYLDNEVKRLYHTPDYSI